MTDLIGIGGQVNALSAKLLNSAQIDRMIGANTAEDAFRVLTELQYADYLDQSTKLSDFDQIMSQGLKETHNLLLSGAQDHPGLDFLWLRFDVNNLKRALKAKWLENESVIVQFKEDKGYSQLGKVSLVDLNRLVFEGKLSGSFPYQILEVVPLVPSLMGKNQDFRVVEFALDKAYFQHLNAVATQLQDDFISDFFTFLVNLTQTRNLARSVLTIKEPIPASGWLPFGHLNYDKVGKISSYEDLVRAIRMTEFGSIFDAISDKDTDTVKMLKIEEGLDKAYSQFLTSEATGSLDSPAVLINYFRQRLHNARVLKLIMYGKLNGLEADKIYKLIETV